MGFDSIEAAFKMREVVTGIAESVVSRMRPEARLGQVMSQDVLTRRCWITFPGETDQFVARYPRNRGPQVGDLVQVSMRGGLFWVTDILEQNGYGAVQIDQQLVRPRLRGGALGDVDYGAFFSFNASGVSLNLGEYLYLGAFKNTESFYKNRGVLDIHWNQGYFANTLTRWQIFWSGNDPAGDVWNVVLPVQQSGIMNGMMHQLEAKAYGDRLHLRIKRKLTSAGTYGGIGIGGMWAYGNDIIRDPENPGNTLMVDTEPTTVWGVQTSPPADESANGTVSYKGPYYDSEKFTIQTLAQMDMTGGGVITWTGQYLSWSQAFRCFVAGGDISSNGYIDISGPTNGETVLHHGLLTASQTVASSRIDMTAGGGESQTVLFYDPPLRGSGAHQTGRFHLVGRHNRFSVPSHWIMIARLDTRSGPYASLKLGVGRELDHWRDLTLLNSWENYGSPFETAQYKRENGMVYMKGLVRNGVVNTAISSLPVGYRPGNSRLFIGLTYAVTTGAQSAGTAHTHNLGPTGYRFSVSNTGSIVHGPSSSGSQWNEWFSLESQWQAEA